MSFCTRSRISTLKWALSYDTPEIAHFARRKVAYREIGALIDSIQLPPRLISARTHRAFRESAMNMWREAVEVV